MSEWLTHFTGLRYKTVEISCVRPDRRNLFLRRRQAVMMRLDGAQLNAISDETGLSRSEIVRIVRRFKEVDEDGVCYGEMACIPGFRIKPYERKKPFISKRSEQKGGMAGVMGCLLAKYPTIKAKFAIAVLRRDKPVGKGMKYQKTLLYNTFYELCRSEGVSEQEWPLCQYRGANKTISKLIDEILEIDFSSAALAVGGPVAAIHSAVGNGVVPLLSNCDVLDVVEIDSHYVDGKFVLNIKGDRRLTTSDVIDRFWIIAAKCRKSKAILAARYVFSSEVSAVDVFQVICDAFLGGWQPRESFSFPNLEYTPGAGMPHYVFPALKYHCISSVYLDNAMQHYANSVKDLCLNLLGAAIDYGPLNNPARRSNIEGLFKVVASRIMHPLPSTTGSHPHDGRSDAPDTAAVYYKIIVDEAIEVLDVCMANYNDTPMSGANKSNTPLDAIRAYIEDKDLFFPTLSSILINAKGLGLVTRKVRVQGSIEKGIRPRIKLDKALYTSPAFSEMTSLIGSFVLVRIDPNDYRQVVVYFENGVEIGALLVEAAWRDYKHSIETRKKINRAQDKKLFSVMRGQRPIVAWLSWLTSNRTAHSNLELQRFNYENPDLDVLAGAIEDKNINLANCVPFNGGCSDSSALESKGKCKWEDLDEFKFEG